MRTSKPGRARQPRLKLVSHSLSDTPRRQVAWDFSDHGQALEIWTEAEWAAMLDCERPDEADTWHVPGIGWFHLRNVGLPEAAEISAKALLAEQNWAERRAMEG